MSDIEILPGQMTLDDVPHARVTDPGTSWAAARATENEEGTTSVIRAGSTKHLALTLIGNMPRPAIELERDSGRRGIWKRVSDLKNAGLVEPVGTRRDPLTNRDGLVWAVTDRGRDVLQRLSYDREVKL